MGFRAFVRDVFGSGSGVGADGKQRGATATAPRPLELAGPPVRARSFQARPYQIEGINFLRTANGGRAILADAPGLGKTFQACEAAVLPAIVTCPKSLVDQWADFIQDQYPDEPVTVAAYGDMLKRDAGLQEFRSKGGWLVINHDMWRDYLGGMPGCNTVIADEYHHFRNVEAKRSKAFRRYTERPDVGRVYGLTATPVYKDISDLWHLMHILDQKEWSSFWQFMGRYASTYDYGYGTKVLRARNMKELEGKLAPYMLGRSYQQVGMFLPERIDKHVVLRMNKEEQKRYNLLRDYYRLDLEGGDTKRFFNAGAVLHELRRLTVTKSKIDAVREIIDDTLVTSDRPVVVFVWYKDTAEKLARELGGVEITGDINPAQRRMLALTGGSTKTPIRVVTQESLSEGVDLSESRTVIYVEETYVPGKQYQSLSRVQRLRTGAGNETDTEPVVAYWVRYASTVDQVVHNTVRNRTTGNALTVLKEALA